jgi:hypothetical protein
LRAQNLRGFLEDVVASEDLVGALSGQNDLHIVLADQPDRRKNGAGAVRIMGDSVASTTLGKIVAISSLPHLIVR